MSSSIMHQRDGSCFMCNLLGLIPKGEYREEHHVFNGANRRISEHYGLKVYLCIGHHRIGDEAVHNNKENMLMLKKEGQKAFMTAYPDKDFRKIFGKNYIDESDMIENRTSLEGISGFELLPGYREHIIDRFTRVE